MLPDGNFFNLQIELVAERGLKGEGRALEAQDEALRQGERGTFARIASTAAPSEAPGARLKETKAAGNWPRWSICSGAGRSLIRAIADSGTWPADAVEEGR